MKTKCEEEVGTALIGNDRRPIPTGTQVSKADRMTVKEFVERHYSHKPDEYVTLACIATPDNPLVVLAKLPVGYIIGLTWMARAYRSEADADIGEAVHAAIDGLIKANSDDGERNDFDIESVAADFWAENLIRLHPGLAAYQI